MTSKLFGNKHTDKKTKNIKIKKNKNITKIGKMKKGRNINITDFDDITNLDGYKHKF